MRPRARYSVASLAVVEPRRRHRAPKLGERAGIVLAKLHEREDRLGVDGHLRLRPLDPVAREQLVVVGDDPVVDADDRAVPDRVVVGLDVRVALREVPDVDQRLARRPAGTESSSSNALAPPRSFVTRVGAARAAMGVADGVGAALGDAGEQRLRSERSVDGRLRIEAESGDAAHGNRVGSDFSLTSTHCLRGSDDTKNVDASV